MAKAPEWIVQVWGGSNWFTNPVAACDEVVQNSGARPSTAKISIKQGDETYSQRKEARWNDEGGLSLGTEIRVIEADVPYGQATILFSGIITSRAASFAGGGQQGGGHEYSGWFAQDMRYVMAKQGPVWGRYYHHQDAYSGTWSSTIPTPNGEDVFFANGRRCIFNENDKPNKDPELALSEDGLGNSFTTFEVPVFGELEPQRWKIRDMVEYIIGWHGWIARYNGYAPLIIPENTTGLTEPDWDLEPAHIVLDSVVTVPEALEYLADRIGWKYRLDTYWLGETTQQRHVFYKPGVATVRQRGTHNPITLIKLYCPDNYSKEAINGDVPTEDLSDLLADDTINLVRSGNIMQDTQNVINVSAMLGERVVSEITVELVPAWVDFDLTQFNVTDEDPLYLYSDKMQDLLGGGANLNEYTYFTRFHTAGDEFRYYAGRKWALNEIGTYSGALYDRGDPFAFPTIIYDVSRDELAYAPRTISDAITSDAEGNSISHLVEYSLDGGTTWHKLAHKYKVLPNEFGIYIDEPNLADIKPDGWNEAGPVYEPGPDDSDGQEGNFWTAIYRDEEKGREFKDDEWQVRVRITASVQLDDRLMDIRNIADSGATIDQYGIYDYSQHFLYRNREAASQFEGGELPPNEINDRLPLEQQHQRLLSANAQGLYSASFSLPVIHLSEGSGAWSMPRFVVGDCVESIEGRGVELGLGHVDGVAMHPTIEQIIYNPELAETEIVTADLRTSRIG